MTSDSNADIQSDRRNTNWSFSQKTNEKGPKKIKPLKQSQRNTTFRNVDVALQVVDIQTPEDPGQQVQQGSTNVVAQPPSVEVGKWGPPLLRQHRSQNDVVVPGRLFHEQPQLIFHRHGGEAEGSFLFQERER